MSAPAWIVEDMAALLSPPAEVRAFGNERSAANTLAATRALFVMQAKRYQPSSVGTKCNLFLSDVAQILSCPLPHRFDIGKGLQWMSANNMVEALRRGLYPNWSHVEIGKLGVLNPVERAALGLPTVAVWPNPDPESSGHVVWVVPTPAGKVGIYVTGAGRNCVQECPIESAFGKLTPKVIFYGHE